MAPWFCDALLLADKLIVIWYCPTRSYCEKVHKNLYDGKVLVEYFQTLSEDFILNQSIATNKGKENRYTTMCLKCNQNMKGFDLILSF